MKSRALCIVCLFLAIAVAVRGGVQGQEPTSAEANAFLQQQDWAKAAAAYEALAKANPSNGQYWFRLGLASHELGRYEAALQAYSQAQGAGFFPGAVLFRSARTYAKMRNLDKAFELLTQLTQNGFAQVPLLETDADLEALRGDARYAVILATTKKNARPCDNDPNYRMFDFWVGEWNVTSGGQVAGTNRIELIENNCVVYENWTSAQGGTGRSFNFYNNQTKKWNQVWVASNGNNLFFEGEFRDGTLYYTGSTIGANGAKTLHQLTFFNLGPGHVRQLWKSSTDGGATWTTAFDGDYRKKQ